MNEKELRQKFVDMAIAYVGVVEGDSRHREIVDIYNSLVPLPQGYKLKYTDSWCAAFVSVIAKKCGLLDLIPVECSCYRQITLWQKLGRWQERDDYTPKVGDIAYYDWDDNGVGDNKGISDHVGIVVSVAGNGIKVIEGNYSNAVKYRVISINNRYIRGYGLPDFTSRATSNVVDTSSKGVFTMQLKTLSKGSKGEQVRALQFLLIGRGHALPKFGADGDYGDETVKAVKVFQASKNIAVDGIAGKDTFGKLLGVS